MSRYPILAVVGQTASGKTGLALALAKRLAQLLPGFVPEVVGADAFQLYRGMDIGTAKVTAEEAGGIVHHLVDVLEIGQEASVAAYQKASRKVIEEIYGRGATPIVVGGSGLYVRAVLDRISFPGTDPVLREKLYNRVAEKGIGPVFAQLRELDPVSAEKLNLQDTRRVVRALEVCLLTGVPFSATMPDYTYFQPTVQLGIEWDKTRLLQRIEQRSEQMLEAGFLREVEQLAERGLATTPTAIRATGYRAALSCLAGELSETQLCAQISLETRQLAQKQKKWFRRDPRITWLQPGEQLVQEAAESYCRQAGNLV